MGLTGTQDQNGAGHRSRDGVAKKDGSRRRNANGSGAPVSVATSSGPTSKGGRPRAGTELTAIHLKTIEVFLETANKAEVGRRLKISESQVARMFKLPIVRAELARRTDELKTAMEIHMRAAGPKAFSTLIDLLDDPNPAIRLRTAIYLVDRLLSLPAPDEGSEVDAALDARIVEVTRRLSAGEQSNA
jgi:hypothetical protein